MPNYNLTFGIEEGDKAVGPKQQAEAVAKKQRMEMLDRVARQEYRQEEDMAKKAILSLEAGNFSKIYVLKCVDGWMKVFNHSGVILAKYLDGRLGRHYELNDDKGYGADVAMYGVVSIPPTSVLELVARLVHAGIKLEDDTEWMLTFDLGEKISQEEITRLLHENELIIDKVNQLIMPRAKLPKLRAYVKTLMELVHTRTRDQKSSMKNVFLNDAERVVVEMNKKIIATSRGAKKMDECVMEIFAALETVYENITTMSDLKLITAKQYKELADATTKVYEECQREMKRWQVARVKKAEKAEKTENDEKTEKVEEANGAK